jgi:hypothetical protein
MVAWPATDRLRAEEAGMRTRRYRVVPTEEERGQVLAVLRKGRSADRRARHGRDVALTEGLVDHVEPAGLAPVVRERASRLVACVAHERRLVREGLGQDGVLRDRAPRQ